MKYNTYTLEQKEEVKTLFENGKNKCEISLLTGIPRSTIKGWLIPRYVKKTNKPRNSHIPVTDFEAYFNTPEIRKAYAFILGIYLCDGCITIYKTKVPTIRFFNDSQYPINTKEWGDKLKIIMPENSVNCHRKGNENCYIVNASSRKFPQLFPQHGKGVKHNRPIILTDWQKQILDEYPQEFIRACIQSDGCIFLAKQGVYTYKRYSFVNKSVDIMNIFVHYLSLLGITQKPIKKSNGCLSLQVQNRKDVLILENIISKKE